MAKSFCRPLWCLLVGFPLAVLSPNTTALDWVVRNPRLIGPKLNALATGPIRAVAVGVQGHVVSSSDGVTWSTQSLGVNRNFSDALYANGTFVAVGALHNDSGVHSLAATSPDGVAWTEQATDSRAWKSVTHGNGTFVAVGDHTIDTSPDGVTWTRRTPHAYVQFQGVAFGNEMFVTMGVFDDGMGGRFYSVQRSSDGVSWTGSVAPANSMLRGITFGNGEFIMAGDGGLIFTSTDGLNWTQQVNQTGYTLNGVAFVGGTFLAVGAQGTVLRSSDGATWFQAFDSEPVNLLGVGAAFGRFYAVGENSTILASADQATWTSVVSASYSALRSVTFAENQWVAVGEHASGVVSSNGTTWESRPVFTSIGGMPNTWFNGVAFGNGTYVAVGGQGGPIYTSPDARTWTERYFNLGQDDLLAVTHAVGRFVAVGAAGTGYGPLAAIRSSTDGIHWTTIRPGTQPALRCIVHGNGVWVTAGVDVFSSSDGTNWTQRNLPATGTIYAAAFGAGKFVMAGDIAGVVTSTDGAQWTPSGAFGDSKIYGMAFGNNQFIGVGERSGKGVMWSSADGLTWAEAGTAPGILRAVSFGDGAFTAVGDAGLIVQSTDTSGADGAVLSIRPAGESTVEVSCRAEVGRQYRLQASNDGRTWSDLMSFRATASDTPYVEAADGRVRLYRLVSP
jgi:hypothetical protein